METIIARTGRDHFVERVAVEFERAGVDYVLLHGWDKDSRDSDLDIAVSPESLTAVDTLIRCGSLGRLTQLFEYDVPYCRYYVVRVDEAGRRYRQLDIASDPWGISRYGRSIRVALEHSLVTDDGLRVAEPAAACLYLSAKRARKGGGSEQHLALSEAFSADPAGARRLLVEYFGSDGHLLAKDLADGKSPKLSLDRLARPLDRLPPPLRVRRAAFGLVRMIRRVTSPTGLVVGVVGPDGTGKSTLAAALEAGTVGAFRRVAHLHLGPGILPPAGNLLGRAPAPIDSPHARTPSGRIGSLARIAWLAGDWLLGWWPRVAYPKVRSCLVVLERGFLDLAVDPRRYRLATGKRVVRALSRIFPSPDVTLVLEADPDLIHKRKPELSVNEIDRQLSAWREPGKRNPERYVSISSETADDTLEHALDTIDDRLAARQIELSSFDVAVRCVGRPHMSGQPFSLLAAGGRPRWILPRRKGAAGPIGAGLYRPASYRRAAGARLLGAAQRSGGIGLREMRLDTTQGLVGEIAEALRLSSVELAASLPTDASRARRALLSVLHCGSIVAYAKVASKGSQELKNEAALLAALEPIPLRAFETPRLLHTFGWQGLDILLVSPVVGGRRPSREFGSVELDALIELAELGDRLAPLLGGGNASRPQHGDFCAWNSAHTRSGKLALWDWEWAHAGHPLEDWCHWHTQHFLAFGRGGADELLAAVLRPNSLLDELESAIEVPHSERETALIASLCAYLGRLPHDGRWQRQILDDALGKLGGRHS